MDDLNNRWKLISIDEFAVIDRIDEHKAKEMDAVHSLIAGNSAIEIFKMIDPTLVCYCFDMNESIHRLKSYLKTADLKENEELARITERARKLMIKDMTRTLDAFIVRSDYPSEVLAIRRKEFELKLQTNLFISSALTTGHYCQGWNFLCASFMIVYDESLGWMKDLDHSHAIDHAEDNDLVVGNEGLVEFMVAMEKSYLGAVYLWGPCLRVYLAVLEQNLRQFQGLPIKQQGSSSAKYQYATADVYRYLKSIDFDVLIFALEWLTTGYSLAFPLDSIGYLLDLIVTGVVPDVLLRTAIAIIALLGDRLMLLDQEGLQANFRTLVRQLPINQVLVVALRVDIESNLVDSNGRPPTNVLMHLCQLAQNNPTELERIHAEILETNKGDQQVCEPDNDVSVTPISGNSNKNRCIVS